MKPKAPAARKRAYLARDSRRQALLDVAARVVEEQGWQGLSMISVAAAGKVSRQLVYQHFPSVDELIAATLTHLFSDQYLALREVIAEHPDDLASLVRLAEALTFDDRPGRTRALWQMLTATYSSDPQTTGSGTRARHLITKMWADTVRKHFELDEPRARALAWMLSMALWGAHQVVTEGDLDREAGIELFTWMVQRLGSGTEPPPGRRPGKRPGLKRES
jgi:AcrR family transcriptional regulator